jgi:uncharacterized membrane protein YoaK (UPF0700 family)
MPPAGAHRQRDVLVVLLAVNSGFSDAFGYLMLGAAFSSVMTGNMVLFGLSLGTHNFALTLHTIVAIALFIAGCFVGTRLAGIAAPGSPVWPRSVTKALAVQLAVIAIYAIGFWVQRSHPDEGWQLVSLAWNAGALGIQSSAVQRFGVSGLSTTYLTGTLTQTVIRLASRRPVKEVGHSLWILGGLIAGGALGAVVAREVGWLGPLCQLLLLGGVVAFARWSPSLREPNPAEVPGVS